MKTENDETKTLTRLLSEWRQCIRKAEEAALLVERFLDTIQSEDDTGAAFGYCAYCYAESCEGCRYRLRRPEKGEESRNG